MTARPRIVAAMLLAVLLFTLPAAAQRIPERLDARDLDRYARILQLSPEQRNAAYAMYEEYVAAFDALHREFINETTRNPSAPSNMREFLVHVKRRVRENHAVRDRIRSLDSALFDDFADILADKQLPALTLTRQHRIRQVAWYTNFLRSIPRAESLDSLDLTELADAVELSPESESLVEPILIDYSERLTALIQRLDAALETFPNIAIIEEIIARGHGDTPVDEVTELFNTIGPEVWQKDGDKPLELARAIHDLHFRTAKQIKTLLIAAEEADEWWRVFINAAYPDAAAPIDTLRRTNLAIDRLDLGDDQRSAIEPMLKGVHRRMNDLLDKYVQYEHTMATRPASAYDFSAEWPEIWEHRNGRRDEMRTERERFAQQLVTVLGPDAPERFEEAFYHREEGDYSYFEGFGRSMYTSSASLDISEAEANHWFALLNLEEDKRGAADEAVARYRFRIKSAIERSDENRYQPLSDEELAKIESVDRELLDAVHALAVDEESESLIFDAIVSSRRRVLIGHYGVGGGAGGVDPLALLLHSGLDRAVIVSGLETIQPDSQRVTELAVELRTLGMRRPAAQEAMLADPSDEAKRAELQKVAMAMREVRPALSLKHVDQMMRLRVSLPDGMGDALWVRFSRIAWGPLIDDGKAMHDRIEASLEQANLRNDQVERIRELMLSYRAKYEELTRTLLEIVKPSYGWLMHPEDDVSIIPNLDSGWADMNEYRRLKKERDDLNDLTRLELELVLDPHDDGSGLR